MKDGIKRRKRRMRKNGKRDERKGGERDEREDNERADGERKSYKWDPPMLVCQVRGHSHLCRVHQVRGHESGVTIRLVISYTV